MSTWFPERQITQEETKHIAALCGGLPPDPEGLTTILDHAKETAFSDAALLKVSLGAIGESCADALDIPPKVGSVYFMRGALLYAWVLQELYPYSSGVPYEQEAFAKLASIDDSLFAFDISERINAELPSYCDLLCKAAPGIHAETTKERNLALIGSGVVHAVAVDSLQFRSLFEDVEASFFGVEPE